MNAQISNECVLNKYIEQQKAVLLVLVFTKPPYEVRETGWGEFEIQIKIYFQDSAEKPVSGGCGEVSVR